MAVISTDKDDIQIPVLVSSDIIISRRSAECQASRASHSGDRSVATFCSDRGAQARVDSADNAPRAHIIQDRTNHRDRCSQQAERRFAAPPRPSQRPSLPRSAASALVDPCLFVCGCAAHKMGALLTRCMSCSVTLLHRSRWSAPLSRQRSRCTRLAALSVCFRVVASATPDELLDSIFTLLFFLEHPLLSSTL